MASLKSFFSAAQDLDEQSLFKALCQVHDGRNATDGPEIAVATFLREVRPANSPNDIPAHPTRPAPAAPAGSSARHPDPTTSGRDALMDALRQTLGEYRGLLNRYNRDFDAVFEKRARELPDEPDETIQRLRQAQALLIKYPVAGQAVFAALVKEGRRFAKTTEGTRWKTRLASSSLLATARTLFEGISGGMVSEGGGALPSVYVDAFLSALDRQLEEVLAEVAGATTSEP
jgi:hypothetical protein